MKKTVLRVNNVIKRFPGTIALRRVSFDLYEHEILALVGENGAGKSTLMKILSGAYPFRDYEGEITLEGKICTFSGPADAENAGISMIYQELNLELDLSVAENIVLGQYQKQNSELLIGRKPSEDARKALDQVGLDVSTDITVQKS